MSKKFKSFYEIIADSANLNPDTVSLILPKKWQDDKILETESLNYIELSEIVVQYIEGLKSQGFKKGDRALFLLPVSVDMIALLLAVGSLGGVVVFVDTGMGFLNVLRCIRTANLKYVFSVNKLLKFWLVLPFLWFLKKYSADTTGFGYKHIKKLKRLVLLAGKQLLLHL